MTNAPNLEGPVAGGKGIPFAAPTGDLAGQGYVMEEFLLDGVAGSWEPAPGATIGIDGHWEVVPGAEAPYRTRMYVVRPSDPGRCNGVVVVNWQNVTAGQDLGMPQPEIYRGYAWVGVSAQRVAIEGMARGPFGATKGLVETDPERYGTLHHPGDAHSYDIYTQASRLVAPNRETSAVDPLGGLEPRLLIATGGSQSAIRLVSYLNMVQGREGLFDGFYLNVPWGMAALPPDQKIHRSFAPVGDGLTAGSARIRSDLDVPILELVSETETPYHGPVRQPDTDTFRFWEMAGTAHATGAAEASALFPAELLGDLTPNQVVWDYLNDAALRHLVRWVDGGTPPPSFPPIAMGPGPTYEIARDEWGNATGGMRLPEVEAPLGTHLGGDGNQALGLLGESIPFTPEQVKARWSGRDEYLAAWDAAVEGLLASGLDLEEQAPALRERGRRVAEATFVG